MERPHKKLLAWERAIELAEHIYKFTGAFPSDERFGLTSQMRRAAVSISSNIAEGAARFAPKDKLHFYIMARGSLSELDTQCEIVKRLGYKTADEVSEIENRIGNTSALLQGLINQKRSAVSEN